MTKGRKQNILLKRTLGRYGTDDAVGLCEKINEQKCEEKEVAAKIGCREQDGG